MQRRIKAAVDAHSGGTHGAGKHRKVLLVT